MKYSVQRYCAKNDVNGNPRRVYVIRNEDGDIVATADEGYIGVAAVHLVLLRMGIDPTDGALADPVGMPPAWWRYHSQVTDIGDVDVSPGVYRRMVRYVV